MIAFGPEERNRERDTANDADFDGALLKWHPGFDSGRRGDASLIREHRVGKGNEQEREQDPEDQHALDELIR